MSTVTVRPFDEVREALDAVVASSTLALRAMGRGPIPAIVDFMHWQILSYKAKQVAARLEDVSKHLESNYANYIAFDQSRKGFFRLTEDDRKALANPDTQETLISMEQDIAVLRKAFPKTAERMQRSVDASMRTCRDFVRAVPPSVKAGQSSQPTDLLDLEALSDALQGVR